MPIAGPSCIPIAGPSHMPMAAPSVPTQGRVDWQQRLEQGFQARQNQQLQNHGHILSDQTYGVRMESQWSMAWWERYAEEEHLHAAYLAKLGCQCEEQREMEGLAHLAHLANVQRKYEHERGMEVEQHGQHLDELQQLQREQMERGNQAHLAELDQHQQHLAELQVQQELQEQQWQEEAGSGTADYSTTGS